jgi:hypothetical protein
LGAGEVMADIPPPPPGFTLDATPEAAAVPPPPPGFTLDSPDAAPAIVKLAPRDFDLEVAKRVRAGQSAQEIRDWATTVRDPNDPTGTVIRTIGPELEQVVENVRSGSGTPVEVLDVTKGDPWGAALRSGLDAATFNFGDEATAALKSLVGDQSYEDLVRAERSQRAIDAQTNPNEQGVGTGVGTVASAFLPMGKVLEAPKLLGMTGRVARGAGVGAAMSGLAGVGAAQDTTEAADRLPADVLSGAALGAALPVAGSAFRYLKNNFTDQGSATSALDALGLSPSMMRAEAENFRRATGRAPTVADVVGPRIERLRGTLAGANETRYAAADAAEAAAKDLQAGILERTQPRVKAAQDMFDNAERRGDIEFAKFREVPVTLAPTEQVFLSEAVISEPGALGALKANDRQRIEAAVQMGQISGGDLDLLRRSLRKQSRTDMGVTYSTLAEQVEDIMATNIPEAARAVRNYARRMTRAEGIEKVGEKALTSSRADFTSARNRPELQAPSGISAEDRAVLAGFTRQKNVPPPETRGAGQQYHGARGPIDQITEGYYNPNNIYGGAETFYTTDALDVASGYGRKNPNAVIYSVKERQPVKMFDMEQKLPPEKWTDILGGIADDDMVASAIEEVSQSRGSANLRQIMDEIRTSSSGWDMSKDEIQELFSAMTANLESRGYGGMTHQGGLKTGARPHTVKIYFRPHEQIDLGPAPKYEPGVVTESIPGLPAKDTNRLARQGGARTGAYNAVAAKAGDNAVAAYDLAAKLEGDTNAAANIRTALAPAEADALIRYVTAQKRAVDNLAALAGVPAEDVPTVIGSASQMIKAATIVKQGGGAAIVSNWITETARELGLGRGPALKLAENLFNPAQFERTMQLLEKRNISNSRVTQVLRNAFFKVASDIDKDNNRPPENAVTAGAPQ